MLGDAHAQSAAEASLQRLRDLFEMRQREADLFAAGDDNAVGVEQAEPASVTYWVATRSGIMRAPSAVKAGSAGAAGARPSGLGGSTLPSASSNFGQIG